MKRLLVTGASGLLGLNFSLRLKDRYEIVGVSHQAALKNLPFRMLQQDLSNADAVNRLIDHVKPDAIAHFAAMANVDDCERNQVAAEWLNAKLPGVFAQFAAKHSLPFLHVSTDAVFDGADCGESGYHETDAPHPINFYARTKLAGENEVFEANENAAVARVNFYGISLSGKRSLCEFFYSNLKAGNTVSGFIDVFFCPLYVNDLVDILEEMLVRRASGLYHVFNRQHQSKYAFGISIARKFGFDEDFVKPISWKEGGLTAKRSPNLIMNTEKLENFLGEKWAGLDECLAHYVDDVRAGLPEKIQQFKG